VSFKLNKNLIISPEAQQIITALLIKEPKDRLGTVAEGQDDGSKDDEKSLKSHNFFKGVDWKGLEEGTVAAPFKPAVASETCNFDKEFTAQPPVLDKMGKLEPKIAEQCRDNFKGFSFCANVN